MFKHAVRVSYVLMVVLLLSVSVSLAQDARPSRFGTMSHQ
jgi:hypothetical protein